MEPLTREASRSTPRVDFDGKGVLVIEGESYPEDAAGFYGPVLEWLRRYVSEPAERTTVDLKLSYLNTSSAKCMMTLLALLEQIPDGPRRVRIIWRYEAENEMAYECGRELTEGLRLGVTMAREGEQR